MAPHKKPTAISPDIQTITDPFIQEREILKDLRRVVRKPVNVNPGLKVTWSITFSYLKMFFSSNFWCSLILLQLKTEGQII